MKEQTFFDDEGNKLTDEELDDLALAIRMVGKMDGADDYKYIDINISCRASRLVSMLVFMSDKVSVFGKLVRVEEAASITNEEFKDRVRRYCFEIISDPVDRKKLEEELDKELGPISGYEVSGR